MADRPVSLFVLAGEPSGDRIGGALVEALRRHVPLSLSGVGGPALAEAGLASAFPMTDLSVMGVSDVLKRLPLLLWRLRQATRLVLKQRPDVVVLIDSQVFCSTLARRLRRRGFTGPILLYVAPAVWAWRPERAPGLKTRYDEVLAVLPFEPQAMARLGGPETTYVGHPALAGFPFRRELPERGPLLLLPGSRVGEIARTLPMMQAVAERLHGHPRVSSLILPTPSGRAAEMRAAVARWAVPVEVVTGEAAKHAAFGTAVGAAAVSGTVTLELALAGVPTIATYVGDRVQAERFLKYKVKFVVLPNIVLDRLVVPELLFPRPEPVLLADAVTDLLDDRAKAEAQLAAFAELRGLMESGLPDSPLTDPAERILARLRGGRAISA
jgi:lipid-A-disaccharide synthase